MVPEDDFDHWLFQAVPIVQLVMAQVQQNVGAHLHLESVLDVHASDWLSIRTKRRLHYSRLAFRLCIDMIIYILYYIYNIIYI